MTRGRPRTFDGDQALDAAMRVFWAKGFAASSIEDIAEATGLQRPSLYAAFGNKAALFSAALNRFMAVHVKDEIAALTDVDAAPEAAVARSLDRTLARLIRHDTPHGCMVAQAIVDAPVLDLEIRAAVGEIVNGMESAFAACTRSRVSARLAVATIIGLGALARTHRDPAFFAEAFSALRTAIASKPKTSARRAR
jgi:TetR/AcrR family transcriptional regulator, copper-responsive repressor